MQLPHKIITVQESALNMYAAIDIAEAKLKAQLEKYKETHTNPKFYRHILKRMNKS